jgi:hypothetical protein
MKNILNCFILILLAGLGSSCLKSNLEDLPAFTDAEITSFNFEYRWIVNGVVKIKSLSNSAVINSESATVTNTITIPPADGDFTTEVRSQVSLSTLVGFCYLSTAALIEPVDGAPKLGIPGDFSGSLKYKVSAADGTTKTWTVTTTIKP